MPGAFAKAFFVRLHDAALQQHFLPERPEVFAATVPTHRPPVLGPVTILSALAGATEHIDLIATTTTNDQPYSVGRTFTPLDGPSGPQLRAVCS